MRSILAVIEDAEMDARIALGRVSGIGSFMRELKSRVHFNYDIESVYRMADEIRDIESKLADLHKRCRLEDIDVKI